MDAIPGIHSEALQSRQQHSFRIRQMGNVGSSLPPRWRLMMNYLCRLSCESCGVLEFVCRSLFFCYILSVDSLVVYSMNEWMNPCFLCSSVLPVLEIALLNPHLDIDKKKEEKQTNKTPIAVRRGQSTSGKNRTWVWRTLHFNIHSLDQNIFLLIPLLFCVLFRLFVLHRGFVFTHVTLFCLLAPTWFFI